MGILIFKHSSKVYYDAFPILVNGQVINYTNCIKVLGVNLDSTLSGSDHCRAIVKKCYGALSRLKKCSECLPQDIKLTLVKSLVFPHLDSACGLFLDLASELSVKSQRCNNAALRFATGVRRYDHISPIYAKLNILRFEERRSYICLCLLANILATERPDYIANQLQFRSTDTKGSLRRSKFDLHVSCARTSAFKHSFAIHVANLWNLLAENLRLLHTQPAFKPALAKFIISQRYSSSCFRR